MWNKQVQTDRTAPNNKLDVMTYRIETETCMLIDVAVSEDRNAVKKEAVYFQNIKSLQQEHSACGT